MFDNMVMGETTPFIAVLCFKSVLTGLEMEGLKMIHSKENASGTVGEVGSVNPEMRKSQVAWLDPPNIQKYQCHDIVNKVTEQIDSLNKKHFKFNLTDCQYLQITQYDEKDKGFYNLHTDSDYYTQENIGRKLSFVIQMSNPDEYEGGDFCILNANGEKKNLTKEMPQLFEKGNIILFPSFLPHEVTSVTKGRRYTLVGWCIGPRFV